MIRQIGRGALILLSLAMAGCATPSTTAPADPADLILVGGRVYTLAWSEPSTDGTPAPDAPVASGEWRPDAQAIAIDDGNIVFVGTSADALAMKGPSSQVVDLAGATVIPGLVESHTHVLELGAKLEAVDLTGIETEEAAVALVAERARSVPAGEWIYGAGWDEGAWADRYPDKRLLSDAVPDHPVVLRSLHGFALWANDAALEAAGINASSDVPVGGEMRLGPDGEPTGLFLNRATTMLDSSIPAAPVEALKRQILRGMHKLAEDGYVTLHEAGVESRAMQAFEELEAEGKLPIRVYAMLSLRDPELMQRWIAKGPDTDTRSMLVTRSVKAYYDGALGSRGARLLDDYSDRPGHRGISGDGYGFDQTLNLAAMKAGFQVGIHAIGDAGNREALDILEQAFRLDPSLRDFRHRIEHAQVVSPQDMPRFATLGVIASMEPPHAMEDKGWAEDRLGPDRIRGAYAWRTLRLNGAHLTFNADGPGSDHDIFYGLHSAVARQDKTLQPVGGWYPGESVTVEEAIRAYTSWSAYAAFRESDTGIIAPGRWADLTVMDIDPFAVASRDPSGLLGGKIMMTVVDGKIVYQR